MGKDVKRITSQFSREHCSVQFKAALANYLENQHGKTREQTTATKRAQQG